MSSLDNDFYKFTMQSCLFRLPELANMQTKYKFFNRGKTRLNFTLNKFIVSVNNDFLINRYSEFINQEEQVFLSEFLPVDFLSWIRWSKFPFSGVKLSADIVEGQLEFSYQAPWIESILLEVPIMAQLSELNFGNNEDDLRLSLERFKEKMEDFPDVPFMEFGTRRRLNQKNQFMILDELKKRDGFLGTSNVLYSFLNKLQPKGTIAHEWFMGHLGFGYELKHVHNFALLNLERAGVDISKTAVLTDTFTTDFFLATIDEPYMYKINAFRQDSGDPIEYVEKIRKWYVDRGAPTEEKIIIFSDSLNTQKVREIKEYMDKTKHFKYAFGIGTFFSNDVPGHKPLNIVIKPIQFNNTKVVKISDSPGKVTGDLETYLKIKNEIDEILS